MSAARDVRRCALQALYQFDAGNPAPEIVRETLAQSAGSEVTHEHGFHLATAAWEMHEAADAAVSVLTPDWPTYRQPVVDRSILRLAYCEFVQGHTPPKVVINEAVELAREFSTEKSPLFVNGVLDKIYKSMRPDIDGMDEAGDADAGDAEDAPAPAPAPEPTATGDQPACGA